MAINRNVRILNVQIALERAGRPLSATEIIERVPEYLGGTVREVQPRLSEQPDRVQHAARVAFEDDKRALRALGIELKKVGTGANTAYTLPSSNEPARKTEILLNAAESAMVQAAALQWQHAGQMAAVARRGMTKTLGIGSNPDTIDTSTLGRFVPDSQHFQPIFEAWTAGHVIEFEYRRGNSFATETRRVHPWQVAAQNRRWYLTGYDELRTAPRQFLLQRITSDIRVIQTDEFIAPDVEQRADLREKGANHFAPGSLCPSERRIQLEAVVAAHTAAVSEVKNGKN